MRQHCLLPFVTITVYLEKLLLLSPLLPLNYSYLGQLDVEGLLTELLNDSMKKAGPISRCLHVEGEVQSKLKHFLHDSQRGL